MDSGLVEGREAQGRKVFELTDAGREQALQQRDGTAEPVPSLDGHHSPLRREMGRAEGRRPPGVGLGSRPAAVGGGDRRRQAARRTLYRILMDQ
ncbi:hypothetical protein [Streptomyces sp. NPDC001076]